MAGKELKPFLSYTDLLSCREQACQTSRTTVFSQAMPV